MAVAHSAWFVANGLVVRRDLLAGSAPRWSQSRDFIQEFPALAQLGVTGRVGGTGVIGGFQTGPSELVIVTEAGCLRLDLAAGVVVEGPMGLGTWRSTRIPRSPNLVAGLGDPSKVLFMYSDGFAFFDPVNDTLDGPHASADLQFARPGGDTVSLGLGACAVFLPDGNLYVFGGGGYQPYDMLNRTTDTNFHPLSPAFGPLAAPGLGSPQAAWTMTGDVDTWPDELVSGDVPNALLRAIAAAAQGANVHPKVALAVINAESGVRPDAYNPIGRYGLLQLTAEQLAAAGWAGPAAGVLSAPPDAQRDVLRNHLAAAAVGGDADEALLWGALLLPGEDRTNWAVDTVIASPTGPRPELFATHGVADADGDGRLTLGDLDRYTRALRNERRIEELTSRLLELV
jgi:hypothetical protein